MHQRVQGVNVLTSRDVTVVGGGLIGLSCAAALVARGITVTLVAGERAGEASPAAAGMLAPSVEAAAGPAHRFAVAARDRYPSFLTAIEEATGVAVPSLRNGILELALTAGDAERHSAALPRSATWLGPRELAKLEPALADAAGAALHPDDGAVDNVILLDALRRLLGASRAVRLLREDVTEIRAASPRPAARTAGGEWIESATLVLAAGAWVGELRGVPTRLPVSPLRGQMLALAGRPLSHVTFGPAAYAVPRGDGTVVGSTMEAVGFRPGTTPEGLASLLDGAAGISPALGLLPQRAAWSGLRPVTPDFLPIIDVEPSHPGIIYACGHSRNGVLLAPITGDCVAAMVAGEEPPHDITPFSIGRFAR
ncbi:MAG: FAD-dependent oxidoreductase [Gemmatimonadaceae bacterium]